MVLCLLERVLKKDEDEEGGFFFWEGFGFVMWLGLYSSNFNLDVFFMAMRKIK